MIPESLNPAINVMLFSPLAGAFLNILLGRLVPRRIVETIACTSVASSFIAAVIALKLCTSPVTLSVVSWFEDSGFSLPLTLYLDSLSLMLCLMITLVSALMHLHAVGCMRSDPSYVRCFVLMNAFVSAMLLLVTAENLPLLYLGWQGIGFCSYALIGFWFREKKNADAARKAFITAWTGDLFLGTAIAWMYQLFGTGSITQINQMGFLMPTGIITSLALLLFIGAAGKSAQLPLMLWLPDAMSAPTRASALIHAANMLAAGVYLLMRMTPLISSSLTAITGCATPLP